MIHKHINIDGGNRIQQYASPTVKTKPQINILQEQWDGLNKDNLSVYIYDTQRDKSVEFSRLIPQSVGVNYKANFSSQTPFGAIRPIRFYTGGSDYTLSFSIDVMETQKPKVSNSDIKHISTKNDSLEDVLNRLKSFEFPPEEVSKNLIKQPEIYIQIGQQFTGLGRITVDIERKKPYQVHSGTYMYATVNITFTYYKKFDESTGLQIIKKGSTGDDVYHAVYQTSSTERTERLERFLGSTSIFNGSKINVADFTNLVVTYSYDYLLNPSTTYGVGLRDLYRLTKINAQQSKGEPVSALNDFSAPLTYLKAPTLEYSFNNINDGDSEVSAIYNYLTGTYIIYVTREEQTATRRIRNSRTIYGKNESLTTIPFIIYQIPPVQVLKNIKVKPAVTPELERVLDIYKNLIIMYDPYININTLIESLRDLRDEVDTLKYSVNKIAETINYNAYSWNEEQMKEYLIFMGILETPLAYSVDNEGNKIIKPEVFNKLKPFVREIEHIEKETVKALTEMIRNLYQIISARIAYMSSKLVGGIAL